MAVSNVATLCRVEVGEKVGGYRMELLIENLSERDELFLVCSRCSGILRDACTVGSGEQACVDCIEKNEQSLPNLQARNTVAKLKCRCPLSQHGCEWSDVLKLCETHLDTCSHMFIECKLGCEEVIRRGEEQSHLNETCVLRTVKCERCEIMCVAGEINEHSGVCPRVLVDCDLECGERVMRCKLEEHHNTECEAGDATCPFAKYGCELGQVKRRDLKSHLEEKRDVHMELRLSSMEGQIKHQQSLIEYLTQKVVGLENHNQLMAMRMEKKGTINWEIENMVANLNFETIIMNVPSSPVLEVFGYRMRFGWWMEGPMLVVDMYCIGGSKDGDLEWPFRAACVTRFISKSNPDSRSLEVRMHSVEVKRKFPTMLNSPRARIASVDKSIVLIPGFLDRGVLRLEISVKSLN